LRKQPQPACNPKQTQNPKRNALTNPLVDDDIGAIHYHLLKKKQSSKESKFIRLTMQESTTHFTNDAIWVLLL
jgi:hypothetical protein